MVNRATSYDDEALCTDLAKADLTMAEIAVAHNISASLVYKIAKGDSRPELKERIDEIIEANKGAAMRLAKVRARFCVARLVQIANQNEDRRAATAAIEKLLEMGGMLSESGTVEKQSIEIVLTGSNGSDPLTKRHTGVFRPVDGQN
tara:strand:- start:173 stop:613 length:441 start_codon:yes stop_codon:yes gene_type:complete